MSYTESWNQPWSPAPAAALLVALAITGWSPQELLEWGADELSFTLQFLTIAELLNEDRSIRIIHLSSPLEWLKAVCESKLRLFFFYFRATTDCFPLLFAIALLGASSIGMNLPLSVS